MNWRDGWWDYPIFLLLAAIIVFASYIISHLVNAIDKRTKFSGVLVTGTIVALVSSLPEFTSSLVTIFMGKQGVDQNLCAATGNLMGGNLFRTSMLGLTLICFVPLMIKAKTTIIQVTMTVTEICVFGVYIFLTVVCDGNGWFHDNIMIGDIIFGIFSGCVVLAYIFNLFVMYKFGRNSADVVIEEFKHEKTKGLEQAMIKYFGKIKIRTIVLFFVSCSILIILSSMCISVTTENILTGWGWSNNLDPAKNDSSFGYALLLGIVTSIPETITVINLLKLKNINAAISDVLGSNLFSCLILAIIDLIYWPSHTITNGVERNSIFNGDCGQVLANLAIWSFICMICIGIILYINRFFAIHHLKYRKIYFSIITAFLSLVVLCYGAYLIMASPIGPFIYVHPAYHSSSDNINTIYTQLYFMKEQLWK